MLMRVRKEKCRFFYQNNNSYFNSCSIQGTDGGECYVYDTKVGSTQPIACVSTDDVKASINACALSADYRHLIAATGKGYLFRFEYPSNSCSVQKE